jgi:hypothetical protein
VLKSHHTLRHTRAVLKTDGVGCGERGASKWRNVNHYLPTCTVLCVQHSGLLCSSTSENVWQPSIGSLPIALCLWPWVKCRKEAGI